MTTLDDMRKGLEAAVGTLSPAKAQDIAKGMLEPNAAKEQVAKVAADILEWSQRNREKLVGYIRGEIRDQLKQMGGATQEEVDALKKRVRELERAAGMTASGRRATAKKATTKKAATKKPTAAKGAAATPTAPETSPSG
jgi:polyhydroxyalkanoate synthesis regulator phasin